MHDCHARDERKVNGHVHGQRHSTCKICQMGCWLKVYNILCSEETKLWYVLSTMTFSSKLWILFSHEISELQRNVKAGTLLSRTYARWRQSRRTEYFQQQYDPPRVQRSKVKRSILMLLGAGMLVSSLKATFEVYKVLYTKGKIKVWVPLGTRRCERPHIVLGLGYDYAKPA